MLIALIVVSCVLVLVLAIALGRWLFSKDEKIEDRRRAAAKLAGVLSGLGLKWLPEILIAYSVGDYSGMADLIKEAVKVFLNGEAAVLAEFEKVFDSCLVAKLKTETGRAYIAAKLADAAKEADPSNVKEAPQAKAA